MTDWIIHIEQQATHMRPRAEPKENGAPQYGTFSNQLARAFDATSMLRDARIMWSSSILRPLAARIATNHLSI
jgi:hypothetical protein